MTPYEKSQKLHDFYAPERMQAHASGESFLISLEMQAHAEAFGYDRLRADAALQPRETDTPAPQDDAAAKPAARKGR